jgi:hypothetical protein
VIGRCQAQVGDGVQGFGAGNFSRVAGLGADAAAFNQSPGTGVFGKGGSNFEPFDGGGVPGVRGIGAGGPDTSPPSGNAVGVYGQGGTANGDGVQGVGGGQFSGVAGFSDPKGGGIGVFGQGMAGNADGAQGHGSGSFSGVAGFADPKGGGAGVFGSANGGANNVAGRFIGTVQINGDLTVTGNKNVAVPFPDGSRRRLYCMESPDSWFEDFGTGALADGGQVRLDPDFAATVDTTNYHVFLTEYDDNNGLYVTDRTNEGFTMRAKSSRTAHKTSFSYRVVSKRKDVEAPRFLPVTVPANLQSSDQR